MSAPQHGFSREFIAQMIIQAIVGLFSLSLFACVLWLQAKYTSKEDFEQGQAEVRGEVKELSQNTTVGFTKINDRLTVIQENQAEMRGQLAAEKKPR